MPKNSLTAVVVGAGIGGIASAIRLANEGFKVKVFESNAYPGGKLSQFEINGFRFDAGPSLFTMPFLVEELFWISGKRVKDYFDYISLDETCRYFFADGVEVVGYTDHDKFVLQVAEYFPEDVPALKRYLAKAKEKYELTGNLFLNRSLHDWRTWVSMDALKAYMKIPGLGIFKTMHEENASYFKSKHLVQLFDRFATYNGSSPYLTPGLLSMIPHLEHGIGAYFPVNGMYAITQACYQLAVDLGVEFSFNTPVERIIITDGAAKGITVKNNTHVHADVVVSNVDVTVTYRKLMPEIKAPERILSQPKSSSALIFYWGINREFSKLGLHNIFFSADYKTEFQHIFTHKDIYEDPTVYINITSKYKKDDAPEGCENWFTMINVPNNSGQDWEKLKANARKYIIQKLSAMLQTDVSKHIVCEHVLEPITIESKTGSAQGALYGNSSNNKYAAFFRHANFHQKIKGLYFCGGSVHPGGGIPLALKSAAIASHYIKKDFRHQLL